MAQPQVRRRVGGRSARVRQAVLDATIEELTAAGLEAFSIDGVARRADINKTSIYRRWGTKEQLIVDALISAQPIDAGPLPDTGDFRSDLLAYVLSGLPMIDDPRAIAITRAFNATTDTTLADLRLVVWQRRLAAIRELVARARKRGELSAPIDAELLLDLLAGAIQFRQLVAGKPITPAYIKKVTNAVLDGVLPERP